MSICIYICERSFVLWQAFLMAVTFSTRQTVANLESSMKPFIVCKRLCSREQSEWWAAAYRLKSGHSGYVHNILVVLFLYYCFHVWSVGLLKVLLILYNLYCFFYYLYYLKTSVFCDSLCSKVKLLYYTPFVIKNVYAKYMHQQQF